VKRIISIVGMIGAGKTTTINALKQLGYDTLNENYMEDSNSLLHDNRMILSKWAWISNWFCRVEKFFNENPNSTDLFVDRNVIEAGIWTDTCKPLFEPIKLSLEEFGSYGYEIVNICLKCDYATLQDRIKNRLLIEPIRLKLNENDSQYIQCLYHSYLKNEAIWDFIINSQVLNPEQICHEIINFLNLEKLSL